MSTAKSPLYIGNHTTSSKGYTRMARQMIANGGNTFAFFTRNPRGGRAKEIDPEDVRKFLELTEEYKFGKIVAHAPYTLNACAAKENIREFARETMADDLKRMEWTPGNYYNFHPGSHVGQGAEAGVRMIAEMLNEVLTEEQTTMVLLETMSGKGTEMGRNFEELRQILDLVEKKDKMGICLDTCHVWDGGYDIVNNLDGVLEEFDRIIGLEKLKAIHLNDSLNDLGSHKDRHARIGEGRIGLEALVRVIRHPRLEGIPFILETPNDDEGWAAEIRNLREAYEK
ncbi:deoxyribonuclease IV [Blautia sp. OM07-19]|uniref:deoxyribonuclease IV n=1 Tax=Blautia sp. OM07-19 TaxID=2292985 RepID=UPI000E549940|nr:deoxyribonuclease IV [Blautia sp. OM07-19]RHV03094.1 deoxyribonuclease IV [Blautia sp. OM07-19]